MSPLRGIQIDLSCLLRVHTQAEAVETQMVSAQSVGAHTESAGSPQEHEQVKFFWQTWIYIAAKQKKHCILSLGGTNQRRNLHCFV